jgi:transposase
MNRRAPHEIRGPGGSLPLRRGDEAVLDLVMLIEGETSGRELEDVLEQYGRSRSTYYEKLRRFHELGLEGLLARPPGPRSPWRRSLEVIQLVVTTRLRQPDRSASEIARDLAALGHDVSVRSVERTLTEFGLTRPRRPSRSPRRTEPTE